MDTTDRPRVSGSRLWSSGSAKVERAHIVLLPKVNAVVAEDRVGVRKMKVEVRHGVLEEIVLADQALAFPARQEDDAFLRALEVGGAEAVEPGPHGVNAGVQA